MNSESDDDFLNESFMLTSKSNSKKRCRKKSASTPVKSPKKARPSQANTKLLPNKSENIAISHCVNCQMPFNLLLRWESAAVHASSCLETDFNKLPVCPQGKIKLPPYLLFMNTQFIL